MCQTLVSVIVYVTALLLLLDRVHGVLLDLDKPPYASSGCDTTNIQLFCPNWLHNITNAMGHIINITNDYSVAK